ncbi:hypothetical protein L1887_23671 [Cichorium endivia]|nr:hypothetical protein L1887_23671 [Cichorium endivia]
MSSHPPPYPRSESSPKTDTGCLWVRPRPGLNSKGYFNFSPEAPQVTIILDQFVRSSLNVMQVSSKTMTQMQVFICIRAVMGGDTISLSDSSIDDENLPTINQQFLDRLSEMPTSRRFGLIGKTMEENESVFTESDARSFRDSYNTLEIKENEIAISQ